LLRLSRAVLGGGSAEQEALFAEATALADGEGSAGSGGGAAAYAHVQKSPILPAIREIVKLVSPTNCRL